MKKFHTSTLVAILLLAALPLAPLLLGSSCVSNGQEYKQELVSLGLSLWFSTFAWPLATCSLMVWIMALIAHLVIRRRSRRRRGEQVA